MIYWDLFTYPRFKTNVDASDKENKIPPVRYLLGDSNRPSMTILCRWIEQGKINSPMQVNLLVAFGIRSFRFLLLGNMQLCAWYIMAFAWGVSQGSYTRRAVLKTITLYENSLSGWGYMVLMTKSNTKTQTTLLTFPLSTSYTHPEILIDSGTALLSFKNLTSSFTAASKSGKGKNSPPKAVFTSVRPSEPRFLETMDMASSLPKVSMPQPVCLIRMISWVLGGS